jgi:L-seryl-tRNA(Ser) seleniumtransferase
MDREQEVKPDRRRALPPVGRLAEALAARHPDLPAWARVEGARRAVADARRRLAAEREPAAPSQEALMAEAAARARELARPRPGRVVNATGVVLHTNLGRAVLGAGAAREVAEVAVRYSDLELDLEGGGRGQRLAAVREKLVLLSGAEAALAVNNNAAAVLLALDTLARGREVIVSRGELVEIGGSFRVPEILERAGVRLVEVGTTNRTHPRDYEEAIGPETALLLKVHRSNFEQRGFVAEVGVERLAQIAGARGLPLVEDLGSGTLRQLEGVELPSESLAPARLRLGADLVCFSGDKLLGGPQAGIALGRRDIVEAMAHNPLARALRLDKLGLAALDWTLRVLLAGSGEAEIPTLRRLAAPAEALRGRAEKLAVRLAEVLGAGASVAAEPERSAVGGGSLPGFELPTWVVAVRAGVGPDALAGRLRAAPVPVLARIREDALLLDVRTLLDDDDPAVEDALVLALRSGAD